MQDPFGTIPEKVVQVMIAYYRQIEQFSPVRQDLVSWYVQLSLADGETVAVLPTNSWYNLPSFKRYFLEKCGHSMPEYMAQHLTPHELTYWTDDGDENVGAK